MNNIINRTWRNAFILKYKKGFIKFDAKQILEFEKELEAMGF